MPRPSTLRVYIYALVDPRTEEVCYVGQTCRDPLQRFYAHNGEKTCSEKGEWIQELRALGLRPTMCILEQVWVRANDGWGPPRPFNPHHNEAVDAERRWMRYFLRLGMPLKNSRLPNGKTWTGGLWVEPVSVEYDWDGVVTETLSCGHTKQFKLKHWAHPIRGHRLCRRCTNARLRAEMKTDAVGRLLTPPPVTLCSRAYPR